MSRLSDSPDEQLEVAKLVLSLHPDLDMVFFAVLSARKAKLKYPIETVAGLSVLFGVGGRRKLEHNGHTVTFAQVKKYFPPEFFPIENETELMRRALIVLQRETLEKQKSRMAPPADAQVFVDPAFAAGSSDGT
jgi:hypothetical protein